MNKHLHLLLASLVLAAFSPTLSAQQAAQQAPPAQAPKGPGVVELRRTLQESYRAEDWFGYRDAAQQLHALRPNNGQYMYHVVIGSALVGDLRSAYSMMLDMQKQGLSYDFDANKDTIPIRNTQVYSHVNDILKIQGEPMGIVEPWYALGPEVMAPGALAWDPTRESLLLGTIRDGVVFSVSKDGARGNCCVPMGKTACGAFAAYWWMRSAVASGCPVRPTVVSPALTQWTPVARPCLSLTWKPWNCCAASPCRSTVAPTTWAAWPRGRTAPFTWWMG